MEKEFKTLKEIIKEGDSKTKGYINKKIDVVLPEEVIAPYINELLKEYTPEALASLIDVNFIVKSFLTEVTSNIESMINTWAFIQKRNNNYFNTPIKELDLETITKYISGSKSKSKRIMMDPQMDENKSIFQLITNGTLGFKKKVLMQMSGNSLNWFLENKQKVSNIDKIETFFEYLETCRIVRNRIVHNTFVITEEFWVKTYNKSINKILNREISAIKTKDMVNEIFGQVSVILNKTDNNHVKPRLISNIKKEIANNSYVTDDYNDLKTKINLPHFLSK